MTRDGADDFRDFYAAVAPHVLRQVLALTGDREEARDVAQEAFARAWLKWGRLASHGDPAAWVRMTAYRLAVSRWRSSTSRVAAHARHGISVDGQEPTVDAVLLASALRTLPDNQRRVVVLHYFGDLTVEQIVAETGHPAGSIKVWLSRGRAALAEKLSSLAPDAKEDSR